MFNEQPSSLVVRSSACSHALAGGYPKGFMSPKVVSSKPSDRYGFRVKETLLTRPLSLPCRCSVTSCPASGVSRRRRAGRRLSPPTSSGAFAVRERLALDHGDRCALLLGEPAMLRPALRHRPHRRPLQRPTVPPAQPPSPTPKEYYKCRSVYPGASPGSTRACPRCSRPGSICACPPYAHTSPLLPVHPLCMCAPALCSIIGSQEDWRGLVAAICSSRYDPIAPQRPLDHVPKGQGLYLRRLRRDGRCNEAGEFLRDVVLRHVGGGAQVGTPRRHGRRAACAVASHGHAVARRRRDLRLRWPGQGQALQRQLRVLHLAFRVEHQGVRRHGPAPTLPPHGQPDQV